VWKIEQKNKYSKSVTFLLEIKEKGKKEKGKKSKKLKGAKKMKICIDFLL